VTAQQAQAFVDNIHFLNEEAACSSDSDLTHELFGLWLTERSVGLVLISPNEACLLCGSVLTVRKDRPSCVVVYTESLGTVVANHYRKICSRARYRCPFVQHYGFHGKGKYKDCNLKYAVMMSLYKTLE
jgi:hypothetical protein